MFLPFTKMQAVGNDFVLVDEITWAGHDVCWPRLALVLCDRHFGVGADGLLVVGPSRVADRRMRMFNPDGTEDMCGNGLRCVVRYAGEQRGWLPNGAGRFETIAGVRSARLWTDGRSAPKWAPALRPAGPADERCRSRPRARLSAGGGRRKRAGARVRGFDRHDAHHRLRGRTAARRALFPPVAAHRAPSAVSRAHLSDVDAGQPETPTHPAPAYLGARRRRNAGLRDRRLRGRRACQAEDRIPADPTVHVVSPGRRTSRRLDA
jgi:hypothetical protein